ncbi:MAG: GAF domain-containing protein [Anaerolineales bacterium]|nr:GAF domain-containing protein [Anaerolineales bacterium]
MQQIKIGPRLVLSFGIMLLLMFIGMAVGLWQLNTLQGQAQRLHGADTQALAVLRVHDHVLILKDELQRLIRTRGAAAPFAEAVLALREDFVKTVDDAITALGSSSRHTQQVEQLESIKVSVPGQLDIIISLAQAGNWERVQTQLDNELQQISQTTQALVEEINAEVALEQQNALARMDQVQKQTLTTMLIVSLLILLAAGILGFIVTRSIAQPLAHLDAGARALAQGHFNHAITVTGGDELSHLSRVFNHTAAQLAGLYANLEQRVQERTEELDYRYRQLETSIAVGHHITSILDLDQLLNYVAELIKERYGYYFVGVFLLDETGDYVIARAGTGEAGRFLRQNEFRLEAGEGIIGWVAKNRRLARVDDVSQDNRYLRLETLPATRSELALPLMMGKTVLGVLDIESDQPAAFHLDDLPVLQSLADQVAIAIQNASLYESEKARRQLAENLYEASRALSRTLDLAEVLNLILEHLSKTVAYDRAAVMLQNKDELEIVAARGFPEAVNPLSLRVSIKEDDVFRKSIKPANPWSSPMFCSGPIGSTWKIYPWPGPGWGCR